MRRVVTVCLLLLSTSVFAQPKPLTDPETEKRFRDEVAAVSAEAAAAFDEGNAAREANRSDDAIAAYRKAIELAPKVDHPHRRLCGELRQLGKQAEAVAECELALSLAPSPYNKAVLGVALSDSGNAADQERGVGLVREAAAALPRDVAMTMMWCGAEIKKGNPIKVSECTRRLLEIDPDGMLANYFGAIDAASAHDFDEAHRLLIKAKHAGLPEAEYESLRAKLDAYQKDQESVLPFSVGDVLEPGFLTLGIWALLMLVLFIAGNALSSATLRTVESTTASAVDGAGSSSERRLRKVYKAVLLLAGVYFYASMPLMIIVMIAAGCFALYVFDQMGAIPIYLLFLIGITIFATVVAVLRSVFVRSEADPSGKPLDLASYPALRKLLEEVAVAVGTRPVDVVYLVPGSDIAVMERSGLLRTLLRIRSERRLLLGVAQFDGMTQLQLRAILAHEYGHFRNQDTAGGGFAIAVRRSLVSLITRLASSGVADYFNPVWWFVRGFCRMYLGISQGASRLQEVLADRWAVRAYGSAAFVAGYRHVIARSVEFEDDTDLKIKEVLEHKLSLANLYNYDPDAKTPAADLEAKIEKEMNREPDVFDSHPSSRQRLEWATRLDIAREPAVGDDAAVWDLFPDPEQIERAMTAVIRDQLHAIHGVIVSAADDDAADPSDDVDGDTAEGDVTGDAASASPK